MSCSWPCDCMFSQPLTNHSTTTDSKVLFSQNDVGEFEWPGEVRLVGGWQTKSEMENCSGTKNVGERALGSAVFGIYLPSGCACATVFFCENIVRCNKFRVRKLLGFSGLSLSFPLYLNEMYINSIYQISFFGGCVTLFLQTSAVQIVR